MAGSRYLCEYGICLCGVLIKHDPYEVVYDSRDRFYAAYEKEGTVAFMKYVELIVKLGEDMEQMEVLTPVSQCSI